MSSILRHVQRRLSPSYKNTNVLVDTVTTRRDVPIWNEHETQYRGWRHRALEDFPIPQFKIPKDVHPGVEYIFRDSLSHGFHLRRSFQLLVHLRLSCCSCCWSTFSNVSGVYDATCLPRVAYGCSWLSRRQRPKTLSLRHHTVLVNVLEKEPCRATSCAQIM